MYQLSQFTLPDTALPTNPLSNKSTSQHSEFLYSLVFILLVFISHSSASYEVKPLELVDTDGTRVMPLSIATGDLNKDGNQEIVAVYANKKVVVWERTETNPTGWVGGILKGNEPFAGLPSKPKIWLADMDGDNTLDIVISNAYREDLTLGIHILHTLIKENNAIFFEDLRGLPWFGYIDSIIHREGFPPLIFKYSLDDPHTLKVLTARLHPNKPAEERIYVPIFFHAEYIQYECDNPCPPDPGITQSDHSDSNEQLVFIGQKAYISSASVSDTWHTFSINSNAIIDNDPVTIDGGDPVSWGGTIVKPLASASGQLGYRESYDTITKDHVVCGFKACTVFYKSLDDDWISSSIIVADKSRMHHFAQKNISSDLVYVDIEIGDIDGDGDEDIVIASNGPLNGIWKNELNGVFRHAIENNSNVVPLFLPSMDLVGNKRLIFNWTDIRKHSTEIADLTGDGRRDMVWLGTSPAIEIWMQDSVPDSLSNKLVIHGDAIEKQEMSIDTTLIDGNYFGFLYRWEQIECEERPKRIAGVISSEKFIRLCNPEVIMENDEDVYFTPTPDSRPINSPGNIRGVTWYTDKDGFSQTKQSEFSSPRSYTLTTYEKWWETASGLAMPLGTLVAVAGGSYMLSRTFYPLFAPVPIAADSANPVTAPIAHTTQVPPSWPIPDVPEATVFLSDSEIPTAICDAIDENRRLAETSVSEAAPCVRTEWFRLPAHLTCQNYNDSNHLPVCNNGLVPYWRLGKETEEHRNMRLAEEVHLASTPTYVPTEADVGSVIYSKAIVVHEDGSKETFMGRPINVVAVEYSGDLTPNSWIYADLKGVYQALLTYQWQWRDETNKKWVDVVGATGPGFLIKQEYVGQKDLRVKIAGSGGMKPTKSG